MKVRLSAVNRVLTAAVLAGLVICVPNVRAKGRMPVDDASLSSQVHHKLAMLPWYGVFDNLAYQVEGGEVILSGQVISWHARTKYDAENAVKTISGVTKVVNHIKVLPPSIYDNRIRRAEYRVIFSQPTLLRYSMGAIPQIRIIVNGGHVTLEGVVANKMDRNIAGVVAHTVNNVFSVTA
jgi:hyperosmotically inducible protein